MAITVFKGRGRDIKRVPILTIRHFDLDTNTVGDIICQQLLNDDIDYDDIADCHN